MAACAALALLCVQVASLLHDSQYGKGIHSVEAHKNFVLSHFAYDLSAHAHSHEVPDHHEESEDHCGLSIASDRADAIALASTANLPLLEPLEPALIGAELHLHPSDQTGYFARGPPDELTV